MSAPRVHQIFVGGREVLVKTRPAVERPFLLFPSIGEYLAYDDGAYDRFEADGWRNAAYRDAIRAASPERCIVDIGTGRDALWAITAARAGARKVYAIEALSEVAACARDAVARAGVAELVTVITGRSQDVGLPERADVCVSEIIGNIGSAEGVNAVLADAWSRLCNPGCVSIPYRCQTLAAAVTMPKFADPTEFAFAEEALPYLQRAFNRAGTAFDIRLCISGPVAEVALSSPIIVEDLVFDGLQPYTTTSAELTITRPGRLHGFALWINLWCAVGQPPIDALPETEPGWAPIYAPISAAGVPAADGDRIRLRLSRAITHESGHPDYHLSANITRIDGSTAEAAWHSPYRYPRFRATDTYRRLFPALQASPRADN
jgi:protein arginine N-methyltransferase 1